MICTLREGKIQMCKEKAEQIWNSLIEYPIFEKDHEIGLKWFTEFIETSNKNSKKIQEFWMKFFARKISMFLEHMQQNLPNVLPALKKIREICCLYKKAPPEKDSIFNMIPVYRHELIHKVQLDQG